MPVLSYEEACRLLEEQLGLRKISSDVWMGFQRIGVQAFPVHIRLAEAFVQVVIPQNLFTPCNQPSLHQHLTQANSRVTVGKFAIGPEVDQAGQGGGRPLVLFSEFPAGTRQEYTSQEEIAALLKFAFELVEQHHRHLQGLVQQGCAAPPPREEREVGRGLLERLRVFRGGE